MKGLSPIVAVVLLIGFTVSIAGIVSVWITSTTRTQTEIIGEQASLQAQCVGSTLVVKEVRRSSGQVNITYALETGTEGLTNISIEAIALGNTTRAGPFYVNTTIKPGEGNASTLNIQPVGPLDLVRVFGLCQNKYPISTECKSGKPCMVSN
ncbi:MAG: hypothetical protein HY361_00385 [Candidatus Aenigmarchaeota archaeon]|nr:hypothetical protein [Candidatus Aenigmarchaeota archaeon]